MHLTVEEVDDETHRKPHEKSNPGSQRRAQHQQQAAYDTSNRRERNQRRLEGPIASWRQIPENHAEKDAAHCTEQTQGLHRCGRGVKSGIKQHQRAERRQHTPDAIRFGTRDIRAIIAVALSIHCLYTAIPEAQQQNAGTNDDEGKKRSDIAKLKHEVNIQKSSAQTHEEPGQNGGYIGGLILGMHLGEPGR